MGKRKTNTNSQVESVKSNKKECISNPNEQPHQALSAPQVQELSSSNAADELVKAQAALNALESRFAEMMVLQTQKDEQIQALQTENQELQAQVTHQEQELSRSRAVMHDSTLEADDLKTELAFR